VDILLITPYIPYPLTEGGKISQYAIIDCLRGTNSITLVLAAYQNQDLEYIEVLRQHWPDVNIQAINLIPPEIPKAKGDPIKQKIKKVVKSILSLNKPHIRSTKIFNLKSEFESPCLFQLNNPKSRAFIEGLEKITLNKKFDLFQIDFIDYIDLVYFLPASTKKVFVHHEIRFARLRSYLNFTNTKPGSYEKYILSNVEDTELNLLKKFDAVITFSEEDRKKLQERLNKTKVFSAPFPVLDKYFIKIRLDDLYINKLVFVGGEDHYPNKDAVDWFSEQIGDEIKNLFSLNLHVIGKWKEETISTYLGKTYIHFAGYVPDLITYCKNSIMLVPVRIGSGIRTKILYAMAQGVPVVSTSIGCEGLPVVHKESIMIANSEDEFVKAVESLLNDKGLREKLVMNAQNIIRINYSQMAAGLLRNQFYKEIVENKSLVNA
jgi:glycosyltransferase involved in cell wall biosynthesis